jgi:predicted DNA-binding ribbon-helix-helix protein
MNQYPLGQPRSIRLKGRRSSLRLEAVAWLTLIDIAEREALTTDELVERIAEEKSPERSLASAVRVFVADYWQQGGHL